MNGHNNENTLGKPMSLNEVAKIIGCSAWTVRQVLVRDGLPHFRSGPSGKMIFYEHLVTRWLLRHHKGHTNDKGGTMK